MYLVQSWKGLYRLITVKWLFRFYYFKLFLGIFSQSLVFKTAHFIFKNKKKCIFIVKFNWGTEAFTALDSCLDSTDGMQKLLQYQSPCVYLILMRLLTTLCLDTCYRKSVYRLSVTFVHPTQLVEIFGNVFTPFCTWWMVYRRLSKDPQSAHQCTVYILQSQTSSNVFSWIKLTWVWSVSCLMGHFWFSGYLLIRIRM